jgi:trehalose 6-phosphate phosphatase
LKARSDVGRESVKGKSQPPEDDAVRGRLPPFHEGWSWFLDVDGTLLDFAQHPDQVLVSADLRHLLHAVAGCAGGALALVSGRPVEALDRMFTPLRLPAAGQHGAERRDALGVLHRLDATFSNLDHVRGELRRAIAGMPGVLLEDKGMTLALHYRLAPDRAEALRATMRALLVALGDEFVLMEGKMVLELRPTGKDKGLAVRDFMGELPFRGRTPVFVGDDVTDEDGFAMVAALGGHAVKVGPGDSLAPWRLNDAAAVRAWLAAWADTVCRRGG